MRRRVTTLLFLIVLLFGSVATPVLAHPETGELGHAADLIDMHKVVEGNTFGTGPSTNGAIGEADLLAGHHHHCMCATEIESRRSDLATPIHCQIFLTAVSSALRSISAAPPTEPPAA